MSESLYTMKAELSHGKNSFSERKINNSESIIFYRNAWWLYDGVKCFWLYLIKGHICLYHKLYLEEASIPLLFDCNHTIEFYATHQNVPLSTFLFILRQDFDNTISLLNTLLYYSIKFSKLGNPFYSNLFLIESMWTIK